MGVAPGVLTRDMSRLCGEIGAMRRARAVLRQERARATRERRAAVSRMQGDFFDARAAMARQTKASRRAFLSGLKRAVDAKKQELRADLASARDAWLSLTTRRSAQVQAGPEATAVARPPKVSPMPEAKPAAKEAARHFRGRK